MKFGKARVGFENAPDLPPTREARSTIAVHQEAELVRGPHCQGYNYSAGATSHKERRPPAVSERFPPRQGDFLQLSTIGWAGYPNTDCQVMRPELAPKGRLLYPLKWHRQAGHGRQTHPSGLVVSIFQTNTCVYSIDSAASAAKPTQKATWLNVTDCIEKSPETAGEERLLGDASLTWDIRERMLD